MVGGDEHWMWVARVLGRSDEYWHAAINAVSVLKKLRTAFIFGIAGTLLLLVASFIVRTRPKPS